MQFRAQTRIVGGHRSSLGKWPWLVSFQKFGTHNCGGTLISDQFILTAAHCFDDHEPEKHTILLGSNDLNNPIVQSRQILRTVIHEGYDPNTVVPRNDIAIVKMNRKVEFNEYLQPICMTPPRPKAFGPGQKCTLAGWGKLENGSSGGFPFILHDVQTPIIPIDKCGIGEYSRTEIGGRGGQSSINEKQLCAGKLDTGGFGVCNGDSGGPLMCLDDDTYYIAGIVSWSRGCAEKNAADVLTNVEQYLGWISKTIRDTFTVELNSQNTEAPVAKFTCSDRRRNAFATSGTIESQGWPRDYKPNLDCEVHIKRRPDTKAIKIWPQYFALPGDPSRSKLVLYGQKLARDKVLKTFYGAFGFDDTAFNEPYIYTGPGDLIVKFKSGPNRQWLNWGGFKLRYDLLTAEQGETSSVQQAETCGGDLTGTSLHYEWPSGNEKCLWTLPPPFENEKYVVEIVSFDLEPTTGGLYMWHNDMTPGNHISGIEKGLKFDAHGAVRIEFEGYEKTRRGHFTIVWEVQSTVEAVDLSKIKGSCQGDFTEPVGYFASPNYPSNYPDNSHCSWTISANADEIVRFELINFDLERDYDYLKIESAVTGLTTFLDVQHEIYGYENQGTAIISFHSDEATNLSGFLIKYEVSSSEQVPTTVPPTYTEEYDYEVVEENGALGSSENRPSVIASEKCKFTTTVNHHDQLVIRSPGYPNKYPTNIECTWQLELADKDKMMEVKFMNFKVEHISNCTYDRLDMNDGGNISRLCGELGKQVQYVYDIYSSRAQLKFVSDLVKNDSGFELEINVIPRPPTTQPPESVVYQCDFDFHECGFHSGEERTHRWIRHRDNTPSEDTGPQADAGKSGHYMYFEASDRSEGDIGRLFTGKQEYRGDANNEQLDLDPHCFQFKFDMFGKDMGSMNLYLIQDGKKSLVWKQIGASRLGKDDPAWKQVSLTFYPYSSYEFVFEAISGSAYRSDMAVDEVVISQNMCVSCLGDGLFDCESDQVRISS